MLGLTYIANHRHFYFELSWFWCRQTFQKVFWRSWTRPSSFFFSKKEEGQALMHILVSFSFDIGRAGSKRPISYCKLSLFPLLKLVKLRLVFTIHKEHGKIFSLSGKQISLWIRLYRWTKKQLPILRTWANEANNCKYIIEFQNR